MKKRILVMDDDEGILEGFQVMLESEGYDVTVFANAECIKTLSHIMPDLILLDVLLSGADGRTICKQIKSKKRFKNIPVLMMSAALNMQESVMEAGADGFLKKPFEMDELLHTVEAYLHGSIVTKQSRRL